MNNFNFSPEIRDIFLSIASIVNSIGIVLVYFFCSRKK